MACSNHLGIDLHIHSTASDGSLSPSEILDLARTLGLGAIAITDHDSIEGSRQALSAGIPPHLKFLTGVEISAAHPPFFPGAGSFHILGYRVRLDDPVLNHLLARLRRARKNRNPAIIKRLQDCGFDISLETVHKVAGPGQLSRPHIARTLMEKGYVKSLDEAFEKYLANGKPAYVDKYRTPCAEAVAAIRHAGGIAVLAHPGLLDIANDRQLEDLLGKLKDLGIRGLEVYYPTHTDAQKKRYAQLARRHDLLTTGGTDFHGDITPDIRMGSGNGNLRIPYELYEKIIQG